MVMRLRSIVMCIWE